MDLDTIKTIATYLLYVLCIYLVLWAYNAYCGYQFFTDTKPHGGSALTPITGYEPDKRTCLFYAVAFGLVLPETQKQLHTLWYRFFPPKPPRDEDVPMLK